MKSIVWGTCTFAFLVFLLTSNCLGFQEYEKRTLLRTIPCEQKFALDFTRLMDAGEFALISAPRRFQISKEGVANWYPGEKDRGKTFEIKFIVDRNEKLTSYIYTLQVADAGLRKVVLTPNEPTLVGIDDANFAWYPDSISSGARNIGTFAKFYGEGKFMLLEGPERLAILKDGSFSWIPNIDDQKIVKVIIQQLKPSGERQFLYLQILVMARNARYLIHKPSIAFQEFEKAQYPRTIPTGEDFKYDFTREIEPGKFTLVASPGGFKLSPKGVTDFYPGNGRHGDKAVIKFQVDRGGKLSNYAYDLEFARGRARMVRNAALKNENHSDNNNDKEKPKVLNPKRIVFDWYPQSFKPGSKFKSDLSEIAGDGDFMLLEGPSGLNLSPNGSMEWTVKSGNIGIHKTIIRQISKTKPTRLIHVKFLVDHAEPRRIRSKFFAQLKRNNAVENFRHTVLECPEPGGSVMMKDGTTLVVSHPSEAQLIYFDTEKEIEIERVEVDFQPKLLVRHLGKLIASTKGSSIVRVLNAKTGEVEKEIRTGSEAIVDLACHPEKGFVYASTADYEIFLINIERGKATKTNAKGCFLAVDPIAGKYVYAGIQPRNKREIKVEITEENDTTTFRYYRDRWGVRAAMMKYEIRDEQLKLVETQDNAAVNGKSLHVSPDGKRIMMIGGGGWRPKGEGTGGGNFTAIFRTANLGERVGQLPAGNNVIFHPILKLGIINDSGFQLKPFRDFAYVLNPAIILDEDLNSNATNRLFTFCNGGNKVAIWNGSDINQRQGLHLVPLELTDKQKSQLVKEPHDARNKQ